MPKPKKPLPKAAEPYKFKKGVSGNPEGARAHNPIKKALARLTVETYREVIEAVLTGNIDNLKAMVADPKTSAIQVGVATAFMKALQAGDYAIIERIAERIVGKIPDEINLHAKNMNTNLNANLNASVKEDVLKAALAKLESDV